MKKRYIILSLCGFLMACSSKKEISEINVKPLSVVEDASHNTVTYTLPKTVIRIEVETEKFVHKTGPFYRYSQRFLNITDVVTDDAEGYKLKGVKIYTVGKPDNAKQFAVNAKGVNAGNFLNLTPDGILAGVNLDATPTVASPLVDNNPAPIVKLADVNFNDVPMTEKMMQKTSIAAMAEETAGFIYKVRKRRFKILSNDYDTLPPDGQSYEIMLRELNKTEKDFMELFTGKKVTQTIIKTVDFVPDTITPNNVVLFRFSEHAGVVDKMDLTGTPVYIEVENGEKLTLPTKKIKPSKLKSLDEGFYYIRPAKATVKIIDRNKLMAEKEIYIAQFGDLMSLPISTTQNKDVQLEFSTENGSLKSISKK